MPVTGCHSTSDMGELAEHIGDADVKKRTSKSGSVKSRSGSVKGKLKSSGSVKKSRSSHSEGDDLQKIDMLTPKQNGTSDPDLEGDDKKQSSATIKGMWKKAFKNLKSNEKQNWLTKKGSLIRRNNSKDAEEIVTEETKVVDPVYSLLKCAADLPKSSSSKSSIASSSLNPSDKCSGHSSGSTSKGSSPSSSGGLNMDKVPGLSSDFKEYYKQTSPGKKTGSSPFDNINF